MSGIGSMTGIGGPVGVPPPARTPAEEAQRLESIELVQKLTAYVQKKYPGYTIAFAPGYGVGQDFNKRFPTSITAFDIVHESQIPSIGNVKAPFGIPFLSISRPGNPFREPSLWEQVTTGLHNAMVAFTVSAGLGNLFAPTPPPSSVISGTGGTTTSSSSAASFGTTTTNFQAARLGLASYSGVTPAQVSLAGASPSGPLFGAQLGVSVSQLSTPSTFAQAWAYVTEKVSNWLSPSIQSVGRQVATTSLMESVKAVAAESKILTAITQFFTGDLKGFLQTVGAIPTPKPQVITLPGTPGQTLYTSAGANASGGFGYQPVKDTAQAVIGWIAWAFILGFVIWGLRMLRR